MSSTIESFNILDRQLNIHRSYLLEASAGTGKTFAVENLAVRLLVEKGPDGRDPLTLPQILVVTFTRAATSDLKSRIRKNIEDAVNILQETNLSKAHDYLRALIENGSDAVQKALKLLDQALFCFDEAQIFTIHSFCHRMLRENVFESGISIDAIGGDESLSTEKLLQVINDFLRTEVTSDNYSIGLFKKLAGNQKKIKGLKNDLLKHVSKGVEFTTLPRFQDQLEEFKKIMSSLKKQGIDNAAKIIEDFTILAPNFNGINNKNGKIKQENLDKIERFAALFDKDNWEAKDFELLILDGLYFTGAFAEENRKKKSKHSEDGINYPSLLEKLKKELDPFIKRVGNEEGFVLNLANHCRQHIQRYKEQEEMQSFDDLLKDMRRASSQPAFADMVRRRYKAAIIDEFQDTDPVQWDIFKRLFLPECKNWGYLYLVGDPKQSIYAFRHADIYTYFEAGEALGHNCRSTLDTNYRSQKDLVNALNTLFDNETTPDWLQLPRGKKNMDYREVKPGILTTTNFGDNLGSIHFFVGTAQNRQKYKSVEKDSFYPFIAQEILRLNAQDGISLDDFAILVSDRHQARDIAEALKKAGIPSITQRNERLADSPVLPAIRELLEGIISPKNESSLKIALGGSILGWTHDEVQKLEDKNLKEKVLLEFLNLRSILSTQGIGHFFQELMDSHIPTRMATVREELLSREEGPELYNDLLLVVELLADYQGRSHACPEGLCVYLDELKNNPQEDDLALKCRPNPNQVGVQILTIHSSKGLEYGIVFALGLTKKIKDQPKEFLDVSSHPPIISPILDPESKECFLSFEEADAEKLRQLYVAMTRAKYRLYVPAIFSSNESNINHGLASPMELFLGRFKKPAASYKEVYSRIRELDKGSFLNELRELRPNITVSDLDECGALALTDYKPLPPEQMYLPEVYTLPGVNNFMYSYSSITKGFAHEYAVIENSPHDFKHPHKNPHTLPSGNVVGNLLHSILEVVPFGTHGLTPASFLAKTHTSGTEYADWKDVISLIVTNALQMPLPLTTGPVSLSGIDPYKTFRETEFVFPWKDNLKIEGFQHGDDFLKGVIDLVFEHEGKFYILDWKSNWLGPAIEDYHQDNLKKAMFDNHYDVQAKIYKEALRLYLRRLVRLPFEDIFGGVFYVFLRGLSLDHGNQYGVYHIPQV